METLLDYTVRQIGQKNPMHSKKLMKNHSNISEDYIARANQFLNRYDGLLKADNKSLDYAIDCYMEMLSDFKFEAVVFAKTGKYSNTSFEDVRKNVYDNPTIMEYHINGLLLSQFLWSHHYKIFNHFKKAIELLKKISSLLTQSGRLFITVPADAPAIDHIFLFRYADEIRQVIDAAGFTTYDKFSLYIEDVFKEIPEKLKVTLIYSGVLLKKK